MAVYTQRLFSGSVGTNYAIVYTVPTSSGCVLLDLELTNEQGSGTVTILITVLTNPAANSFDVLRVAVPQGSSVQWTGRVGLETGDQIETSATGTGLRICATGYLFQ